MELFTKLLPLDLSSLLSMCVHIRLHMFDLRCRKVMMLGSWNREGDVQVLVQIVCREIFAKQAMMAPRT